MLEHLQHGHLYEPCQLVHHWVQEYWLYRRDDLIFSTLSTTVHLINSDSFCWNLSVPNACSWAVPIVGG